jgi:hypothetical protein
MASDSARVVLCMKWGTKYGPEYVNRLYAMVRRNLTGDFRFVCLTDDASGLRGEVEHYPIPSLSLPKGAPERGWNKLTTFSPNLPADLTGNALFLDLDVVIVGGLDVFFEQTGGFLIIRDWKRRPGRITGNSSVYRFRLGAHGAIFEYFRLNHEDIRRRFRNEQEFLSWFLAAAKQLRYWPVEWCRSYKYHCIPIWPTSYWRDPVIPKGSRILIFHGTANPPDARAGNMRGNWRYSRPAKWVDDYWRE